MGNAPGRTKVRPDPLHHLQKMITDHTSERHKSQPPRENPGPPVGLNLPPPPEAEVRGASLLRRAENVFLRLDRRIQQVIPESLNPLTQSGAIANVSLLIATITGIWLLLWYSPSVHQAYDSLEAVRTDSWLGQLVRSLHRYSSDACIFFILVHAVRIFVARRIVGARWLAWVTGAALFALVWVIGWSGYLLVWDVRAQHIAEGSARFLDVLPFFGQPLASTFLTNDSVPSLLFFLVFFAHMLLPLMVAVALWIHISRLNRPRLLTNRTLTAWIVGTMVILSIVYPATSAARADMSTLSEQFSMDWWYLWPIVFSDRLGGGALWAVFFVGSVIFLSVPWWMRKRGPGLAPKAVVNLDNCHGCTLCSKDCPFDAISMVHREDGSRAQLQAQVDPDLCVGCGICTGACDSDAIELPWLNIKPVKDQLHQWVEETLAREEKPMLAFLCSESAGNAFPVDAAGACPALPGYKVKKVPCAGWVSPRLLESCIQKGAAGILIVGCGPGEQVFREGAQWLTDRLKGARRPILRKRKADPARVLFVQIDRTQPNKLRQAAIDFREGRKRTEQRRSRLAATVAGGLLAAVLAAIVGIGSDLPYSPPAGEPELIVSFRHLSERATEGTGLSAADRERLPAHMQHEIVIDRRRVPVRMRVLVGGEVLLEESFPPRGLRGDGPSLVMERIPMTPGTHRLKVMLGDTPDEEAWPHRWEGSVEIPANGRRVLLFDSSHGFHLE